MRQIIKSIVGNITKQCPCVVNIRKTLVHYGIVDDVYVKFVEQIKNKTNLTNIDLSLCKTLEDVADYLEKLRKSVM